MTISLFDYSVNGSIVVGNWQVEGLITGKAYRAFIMGYEYRRLNVSHRYRLLEVLAVFREGRFTCQIALYRTQGRQGIGRQP